MFRPSIPISAAQRIASYSSNPKSSPDSNPEVDIGQASHRIRLVNTWDSISESSRVLEIGCGQGNCTIVLAEAVGPSGKVDAIDPAPQDYGAPVTLGQAHSWISQSSIGHRVSWHQATPEDFLRNTADDGSTWDVAVLAHCIWYFKSQEMLERILRALRGRVKRICIAEYALQATESAAVPHVFAALARAALESQKVDSDENVQSTMGPSSIKSVAKNVGWVLEKDALVIPNPGLLDGYWETSTVCKESFLNAVDDYVKDQRLAAHIKASREAAIASTTLNGGLKAVLTMDVWLGTFV